MSLILKVNGLLVDQLSNCIATLKINVETER